MASTTSDAGDTLSLVAASTMQRKIQQEQEARFISQMCVCVCQSVCLFVCLSMCVEPFPVNVGQFFVPLLDAVCCSVELDRPSLTLFLSVCFR